MVQKDDDESSCGVSNTREPAYFASAEVFDSSVMLVGVFNFLTKAFLTKNKHPLFSLQAQGTTRCPFVLFS
jgi:hypothetical protein